MSVIEKPKRNMESFFRYRKVEESDVSTRQAKNDGERADYTLLDFRLLMILTVTAILAEQMNVPLLHVQTL